MGARHRTAQRDLLDHRSRRLRRAAGRLRARRPLLPACAGAATRHRGHLHHRLRRVVRHLALHAVPVDGGHAAVPGQRRGLAARHLHLPHARRHRTSRNAHHLLRDVRRVRVGVRWLHRWRPPRGGERRGRLPPRSDRRAHPDRSGVRARGSPVGHRVAPREAGHHPGDRGRARALCRRPPAGGRRGGAGTAGAQPRLLLRHQPGALRHQPRGRRGRDRRPPRHQRRRQVHLAASGVRTRPSASGCHPHLRGQLHLPRARADHRAGSRTPGRRQDDLPRAHRPRQPVGRCAHPARSRRTGPTGDRPGARAVPRARTAAQPGRRHPLGR